MPHIDGYADFLVEDVRVQLGYDAKDNSHDDEVLAKLTAGEKISKSKHLESKSIQEGIKEAVAEAKINQKKFRVFHNEDGTIDEPEEMKWDYEIGDIVNVNSYTNQYKCVRIEKKDGNIFYHFKQGKMIYTYDY